MIIVTNKMTPTTEKMATKRFDFPDLYKKVRKIIIISIVRYNLL